MARPTTELRNRRPPPLADWRASRKSLAKKDIVPPALIRQAVFGGPALAGDPAQGGLFMSLELNFFGQGRHEAPAMARNNYTSTGTGPPVP
jgi:hypothetical protein